MGASQRRESMRLIGIQRASFLYICHLIHYQKIMDLASSGSSRFYRTPTSQG